MAKKSVREMRTEVLDLLGKGSQTRDAIFQHIIKQKSKTQRKQLEKLLRELFQNKVIERPAIDIYSLPQQPELGQAEQAQPVPHIPTEYMIIRQLKNRIRDREALRLLATTSLSFFVSNVHGRALADVQALANEENPESLRVGHWGGLFKNVLQNFGLNLSDFGKLLPDFPLMGIRTRLDAMVAENKLSKFAPGEDFAFRYNIVNLE